MVHHPVPLLSAAGFDLSSTSSSTSSNSSNLSTSSSFSSTISTSSDPKAFSSDSQYFPPSPISESGSKPVIDHSGNFDRGYTPRRQSNEIHLEEERSFQRQNDFSELNHGSDADDAYKRMEETIDYPAPDYCTPLVIKVIVLVIKEIVRKKSRPMLIIVIIFVCNEEEKDHECLPSLNNNLYQWHQSQISLIMLAC